jgi:hypothetical protein
VHHRSCPLDPLPSDGCEICDDLRAAEADARAAMVEQWQPTLDAAYKRGYARGWQDGANGKPAAP